MNTRSLALGKNPQTIAMHRHGWKRQVAQLVLSTLRVEGIGLSYATDL